jgi:hypothetical protein
MRRHGLLEYSESSKRLIGSHWVEVRNCSVVAEAWSSQIGLGHELYEALRPQTSFIVSPSRGLRIPGQGGWLEGYGPYLTVHGTAPEVVIRIVEVALNRVIFEQARPTELPFAVTWPGAGNYIVEAGTDDNVSAQRLIKIVPWDAVRSREPLEPEVLELGGRKIRGASIESRSSESDLESRWPQKHHHMFALPMVDERTIGTQ